MIQSVDEGEGGKSGSTRDHILVNEVCVQGLPRHIFLSLIVKVPLFGACLGSSREPYV